MNDTLQIFQSINRFVSDLHTEFGDTIKSLALYNRLLERTGIMNVVPVQKHIDAFRHFFTINNRGMVEKNVDLLEEFRIVYSDKVYIDLKEIFEKSEKDNKKIIWDHLLLIWSQTDPLSDARNVLKESMKTVGGNEGEFLTNMIDKVQSTIETSGADINNPMAAVQKLVSSGVFSDLFGGIQTGMRDGNLDLGKMVGGLSSMISKLSGEQGVPPEIANMMSMMGPMMANMGAPMLEEEKLDAPKIEVISEDDDCDEETVKSSSLKKKKKKRNQKKH